MNIQLPYSSIASLLETNATASQFAQSLALSGPSIERWNTTQDGDTVFDIEITVNRIDTACAVGIAQEAAAILPRDGYSVKWVENPLFTHTFVDIASSNNELIYADVDQSLCPRFSCIVLDSVEIKSSPKHIVSFLEKAGIRTINNVIDISNYLMMIMGQPVHVFDYDKIEKGIMKLRKSIPGESIQLLDEKTYELPGDDIVIEDGAGRLIDLCGIMGGKLSEVDDDTKRVVLFVQTYDGVRIRRTSMKTGARSIASAYFERGVDSDRVEPTLSYGVKLLEEYAHARVASVLIDLYTTPPKPARILVPVSYINNRMGVAITETDMRTILESLHFDVHVKNELLEVTVPFWRRNDVRKKEDILEEIARIYGYHRIGERIPPAIYIDDPASSLFQKKLDVEREIRYFLRDRGLFEMYTYSAYSLYDVESFGLKKTDHLQIANPISSELVYMRRKLTPSLFEVLKTSTRQESVSVFEIAQVYIPQKKDLPIDESRLACMTTNSYGFIKGVLDNLMKALNIDVSYKTGTKVIPYAGNYASILIGGKSCGIIGELHHGLAHAAGRKGIAFAELTLDPVITATKRMKPFPKTNGQQMIEDLTYRYNESADFTSIKQALLNKYPEIVRIDWVSQFEDYITIRIYSKPLNKQSMLNAIIIYCENEIGITVKRPEESSSRS